MVERVLSHYPQELAEIKGTRDSGIAPIEWRPFPGPQQAAYDSEADELYYGGAAGGGKTDLLLGLACTAHRRSIIFRRQYKPLREIIERSRELLQGHGGFNGQSNLWRLNDGRLLEFGASEHEHDKQNFQGRAHDLKAFDELPQFTESQYRFLIAWNRSPVPGQRCRVVGAGNPPLSAEGEWVIRYWAPWLDSQHPRPAEPGELRWYAVVDDKDEEVADGAPFDYRGEMIQPRSRTFIPARLEDNPILRDSGYRAVLQGIPEPLRSQMLFGDFQVGTEDDPWQVIPTEWVRLAQARWKPDGRPRLADGTPLPMTALGADVARGGKDETALAPRYGPWFASVERHPGSTTPDGPAVAALVLLAVSAERQATINIDPIGVGSSPLDILNAANLPVVAVNFAEGSAATDRSGKYGFINVRAESYWKLREALDPRSGEELALPPSRTLLADLCAPRWTLLATGIKIEAKEDVKKRLGRSPNEGDAVVLSHFPTGITGDFGVVSGGRAMSGVAGGRSLGRARW